MDQIIVKSQKELDAIPTDYNGRIIIEFGTPYNRALVKRKFKYSVVARGNSSVEAWGNSSVEAWENSSVVAWGNSSVVARGNSSVVAWENSSVVAWGNSSVEARENSSVEAWENSSVVARGNSSVEARGNSSVVAWGNNSVEARGNSSVVAWGNNSVVARGNSSVVAWENSSVVARGNSSVEARGNSSVVAWGNSSVEAKHNSQVNDKTRSHKVSVSGNARVVNDPQNIKEYIDTHELENDGKTVRLFKAVHKRGGKYMADWTPFEYVIGEAAEADSLDEDVNEDCGHGIHMAYKEWCLAYGASWHDLAILEMEAEISGVIVPLGGAGKVRAAKAKVIREVPLEECGLYGKMMARRTKK